VGLPTAEEEVCFFVVQDIRAGRPFEFAPVLVLAVVVWVVSSTDTKP
jgi:hypothetical protein